MRVRLPPHMPRAGYNTFVGMGAGLKSLLNDAAIPLLGIAASIIVAIVGIPLAPIATNNWINLPPLLLNAVLVVGLYVRVRNRRQTAPR
jgi:hypothetical protein